MHRILQFLFKYRAFFLFIVLEVVSLFLVYRVNYYHGTRFFNSSNRIMAGLLESSQGIESYFSLVDANNELISENAKLHEAIINGNKAGITRGNEPQSVLYSKDSSYSYQVSAATVINNSIYNLNNFITVNRGRKHGVEEGMAVIGPEGIVGVVRNTSSGYAAIYSMLNSNMSVSVRVVQSGDIATVEWDGEDYRFVKLKYLPRHVKISIGDSVVTSGFNSLFPENTLVGIVEEINLPDEATFYDIKVKLATDFSKLRNVYYIHNVKKAEIDSVEANIDSNIIQK